MTYMTNLEERAEVARAQAGDASAMDRLVRNRQDSIWAEAHRVRDFVTDNVEDLYQEGCIAFIEAVQSMEFRGDDGPGLWAHARFGIRRALGYHRASTRTIAVPHRSLARYEAAMRDTGNDVDAARRLASERDGMDPNTFMAVYDVVTAGRREATTSTDEDESDELARLEDVDAAAPYADFETRETVRVLLAGLDERSERIVRLAAGYESEPMSDAQIAQVLGMTRATVQRTRVSALTSMRAAA